jgi:hypothetical protein
MAQVELSDDDVAQIIGALNGTILDLSQKIAALAGANGAAATESKESYAQEQAALQVLVNRLLNVPL